MLLLDYVTLLTAVGISAAGLSLMIFAAWLMAPRDSFLLSCSIGGGLCGVGLLAYGFYVINTVPLIGAAAFLVLFCGLSMLMGAAHQFRTGVLPRTLVATTALMASVVGLPVLALGYNGLGFAPVNLTLAVLVFGTVANYWQARRQAPIAVASLCVLYGAIGVSFLLCAFEILKDGRPVIPGAPSSWAEDFSLLVLIAVVPAIGAVTLALTQARQASQHRMDALTDSMTGLLNRRALFDMYGLRPLPRDTAVILFDIDRFKSINDGYGHAVGDRVITLFAHALERHAARPGASARLGGEEFALVLPATTAEGAMRAAESVRASFSLFVSQLDIDGLHATASAGIAFGTSPEAAFETVLNASDKALYAAKNAGRDRVTPAELRLACDEGTLAEPPSHGSRMAD